MKQRLDNPIAAPRVLFVASEAFPLAKTGGLADVAGTLPSALTQLGADVWTMIPGYEQALDLACGLSVVSGVSLPEGRLLKGRMPDTDLPVILFDAPGLFRRSGGIYMNGNGESWPDNDHRFAAFCRAAAEVSLGRTALGWQPDIAHANDWCAGLLPAYLRFSEAPRRPGTLFTIHNLAFQGNFPMSSFASLGLPNEAATQDGIEFHSQISFMKAGIYYSDDISTVSPNYAREILTPEFGCGLDGLLQARKANLTGILNGISYEVWDPMHNADLARQYNSDNLTGKKTCKAALLRQMGLPPDTQAPVIASVNRLTHQKMADVILDTLPHFVDHGAMVVVVHGQGDRSFEKHFLAAAEAYPHNVAVRIGYSEDLAHQTFSGADMHLSLARFEPCGLSAMYAMHYGAIPIASAVGGMVDTVEDAGSLTDSPRHGTGFLSDGDSAEDVRRAVTRAVSWYRESDAWASLQRRAMRRDFHWSKSARDYLEIYAKIMTRSLQQAPGEQTASEQDSKENGAGHVI